MQIKHHAVFVKDHKDLNWERLRNDEEEAPYFLPYTKEKYLQKVDRATQTTLIQKMAESCQAYGINKLFSIGSGIAAQEYQLKKFADLKIIVSDYNQSVLRLKDFDVFDDAIIWDAFKDDLPSSSPDYCVLFPRIDTEFTDSQLRSLVDKCAASGFRYICFMPTQLLSLKGVISELKVWLYCLIKNKPRVFCGYFRSKGEFVKLWNHKYKIIKEFKEDNQVVFFLQLR